MPLNGGFARLDGDQAESTVYFLPWHTGFSLARRTGLLPTHGFGACYRLPDQMVSADPVISAACIGEMVGDAMAMANRRGTPQLVVGYSLGTVPATLLAARLKTTLWSFASADRGELMIWSSPAARAVRSEAERNGFCRDDFARVLHELNPIECIGQVASASRVVVGRFDRLVPRARGHALVERAREHLPRQHVLELPLGHLGVLAISSWLQRRWSVASDRKPPP